MNTVLKVILLPCSWLYAMITKIRNLLYDKNIFKSTQFDIPIISVGNIRVGGTGKTPMVEYLIDLLSSSYAIATLSRGYGRLTRGFRLVDEDDNAKSVGDEPLQLYRKYFDKVVVSVGEERILAVPKILYSHPEIQVILLDDAYQHRAIKPSVQLLLTEYGKPFYDDLLMPSGRLRESRKGASRADAIIVTKCPPSLDGAQMDSIGKSIMKYAGVKPIFFSYLQYDTPKLLNNPSFDFDRKVVLVSGIANARPLQDYVEMNFKLLHHYQFRDHYNYKPDDIQRIITHVGRLGKDVAIITTEKDAVKLKNYIAPLDIPVYSLPVKMKFIDNESAFRKIIFDIVER